MRSDESEIGAAETSPAAHGAREAEVRRQVEKIVAAIEAKDLAALRSLYAPDVVSFDIEPPLQHVGIDAKLRNWAKVFTAFEVVAYEVRDLVVTVGDDIAFGYGFGRLGGVLAGGAATEGMWVRITFCFRRIEDHWPVVHDQVSVPFDIATGSGVTGLEL